MRTEKLKAEYSATPVVTDHHSPATRNQDDILLSMGYWDEDCVLHQHVYKNSFCHKSHKS